MNEKTIDEKIAEGYYSKTKNSYPSQNEIRFKIMEGFPDFVGTLAQINAEKTRRETLITEEVREKRSTYNKEMRALEEEFKRDLLNDFGVTKNKRADKCFDLAWQYSHSDGYQAVHYTFEELVELIK